MNPYEELRKDAKVVRQNPYEELDKDAKVVRQNPYEELRKDAKVVTQNLDELNKSNLIFDQYHRKKMEQLLEKDQKRMSKYSSLVVPLVDFLMDIKTLQDTGEHKEIPKDIMDVHQKIHDKFETYPFLKIIGERSPVEEYPPIEGQPPITKIGGRKRKYKLTRKKNKQNKKKTKRNLKKQY